MLASLITVGTDRTRGDVMQKDEDTVEREVGATKFGGRLVKLCEVQQI
jgi:hypothetical protein